MIKAILIFILTSSFTLTNAEVFTLKPAESKHDKRYDYDNSLFKLALEKTKNEYGNYTIQYAPASNYKRAVNFAKTNNYKNYFIKLSYSPEYEKENLIPIHFPVDLGVVGYRVCFISPEQKLKKVQISNINELLNYSIVQGAGWLDIQILKDNEVKVLSVPQYESLFKIITLNRADFFCRGINEIKQEYLIRKKLLSNLYIEDHFYLHYELPRFFYTHKKNIAAAKRIEKGLKIAYKDGSLKELWNKEYADSISFCNIKNRVRIPIQNKSLNSIHFDYKRYLYNPFS